MKVIELTFSHRHRAVCIIVESPYNRHGILKHNFVVNYVSMIHDSVRKIIKITNN